MKRALLLLVLTAFAQGCQVSGQQTVEIEVSLRTAQVLADIDSNLQSADAEVRIRCGSRGWFNPTPGCTIRIDGNHQPALDAEMIGHPFTGEDMVYRIHGGTQALAGALYEALGRHAETTDFQGRLDSRVLQLESTSSGEGEGIKFRCVSDRAAQPTYECWILVSAALVR
jgi:hypothetical protein